ncbi:rod shape-determining protein MreC [Patescibacteria group bacterium]|nr:rod shape-determining protein MreC [Patescibacteria group bacterium]MBU4580746.1 rod shape-determining protein MreC [Patescibacteria group bacterium]
MRPVKRKIKFFVAIIFIAAIIFLNNKNYLEPFKNKFSYFFYYPEIIISKITFSARDSLRLIFEIRKAYDDKIFLIDENNKLRKQISDLKEADNENKILRNILNLPLAKEHSFIDGTVIGKDPYNFSDYLLINRGSEAGIGKEMAVVDQSGFYIGRIINVLSNTAGVLLVTDNRSAISAIDQNTRVRGLVKNDRNIGLYFDMVLQDAEVRVDDIIVSLPIGASAAVQPIAKVISIEKYPNKTFQKIKLSPLADMKKIEKVFILLD